jgi:Phage stabilisation protein
MQIPVLNGIYTDGDADFRISYPINLVPTPLTQGISAGYLRPADGIVEFGTGPGIDRGGINWNGVCYRVMGSKLVSISDDGTTTTLGDVGAGGQVTLDYSFSRLAVVSNGDLYYWDGLVLTQVVDPDLGTALDVLFIDGYFMTTDGEYLVVTELADPTQINPLKYGSSEADPDPIVAIKKIRTEVFAMNRYTIEVFDNIGGTLFPFERVEGAQITKGAVGTHACCVMSDALAFVGGGRNESIGVHVGVNGQTGKISTGEIDKILASYTLAQIAEVVLETRMDNDHQHLLVHLPDQTLVYDATASKTLQQQVWHVLTSDLVGLLSQYRARNLVFCYRKWLSGDPTTSKHGYYTRSISTHYGATVRWEFGTMIAYNGGMSAIVHELELVCLTGRVAVGLDPTISTSYSKDGVTWSQDKFKKVGQLGDRNKRINWLEQGTIGAWRIQRFKGDSQAHISVARLEARLEPLNV